MPKSAISLRVSAAIVIVLFLMIGLGIFIASNNDKSVTSTSGTSSGVTSTLLSSTSVLSTQSSNSVSSLSLTTSSSSTTVQTENSTLGLELSLSVNSTTIPSEDAIDISAAITNTLTAENNITTGDGWPIPGLTSGPCPFASPLGIAVFKGSYELDNISSAGKPLSIWAVVACPVDYVFNGTNSSSGGVVLNVTSYSFLPNADSGYYSVFYSANSGKVMEGVFDTRMDDSATIYAANGTFLGGANTLGSSLPSNYTLVAGDEWGQLVLLHFTVTLSNNLPIVGEFLSSPSTGGCSENSQPVPCVSSEFSDAIIFNCASQAATSSGCTVQLNSGLGSYSITVWYPYVNKVSESTTDNCWFNEVGNTSPPYGYCFMINSTAFVYEVP